MKPYDHKSAMRLTGIMGATAVAMGALGAHALKAQAGLGLVSPVQLSGYETGSLYHLLHAAVLLGIVCLRARGDHKYLRLAFYLIFSGIICFSGSLYLLGIRELVGAPWLRALGPVTPVGGLLLIGGWITLCFSASAKA